MKPVAQIKSIPSANKVIAILNEVLVGALALKLETKQAHWNVKGENFIALHELFDKVASSVDEYADLIAERAVQLGGIAKGGVADLANASAPGVGYATDSAKLVQSLAGALRALADQTRHAIDITDDLKDTVTSDLFTQITAGLDKWRWFVESHRQ